MSANKYIKIILNGIVQGVGFRPFIYKLAIKNNAEGWVKNIGGKVEIVINEDISESFISQIQKEAPLESKITDMIIESYVSEKPIVDFRILASQENSMDLNVEIPKDFAICKKCLREIKDFNDRHYQYAFTNCTHCGPRYSIIKSLPYDRNNTSMKDFIMCLDCQKEYENINDRRFHAQPNSCPKCGITLSFYDKTHYYYNNNKEALKECASNIKKGKIIAIKGIGGFALVCDSRNDKAIQTLRERKDRPLKPFALMVKNKKMSLEVAELNTKELEALNSPVAPIVLTQKKTSSLLSNLIAPDLSTLGIILPYSGIHHLLFQYLNFPIVFTSANLSGEPIIADKNELEEKLIDVYDGILDYNREICNPIDDSIVSYMAGEIRIIRLGRGLSPMNIKLKIGEVNLIGMGSNEKSTLSFSDGNNHIISPYIGDLKTLKSIQKYEETYDFFQQTYDFFPKALIRDKNPYYHSSIFSANKSLENSILCKSIQHHKAHFYAMYADMMLQNININFKKDKVLGFIWDGTGIGDDDLVWGGEVFLGNLFEIDRIGHFEEFVLLGKENAIINIYKIGYSLVLQNHLNKLFQNYKKFEEIHILTQMYQKNINSINTTSVGRLFDGVANLCGFLNTTRYEGQAGMLLESMAKSYPSDEFYSFEIRDGIIKYQKMLLEIQDDIVNFKNFQVGAKFMNTLAQIALEFAKNYPEYQVIFSGGVFQNKYLCNKIKELFDLNKITFYMHKFLPPNDMNLSLGQVIAGQVIE